MGGGGRREWGELEDKDEERGNGGAVLHHCPV